MAIFLECINVQTQIPNFRALHGIKLTSGKNPPVPNKLNQGALQNRVELLHLLSTLLTSLACYIWTDGHIHINTPYFIYRYVLRGLPQSLGLGPLTP